MKVSETRGALDFLSVVSDVLGRLRDDESVWKSTTLSPKGPPVPSRAKSGGECEEADKTNTVGFVDASSVIAS